MSYFEHGALGDTFWFHFAADDTSGSGNDGASAASAVRLGGAAADAAPVLTPSPALLSHANYPAGAYEVAVAATVGNGFATGNQYGVFGTLTVDSQTPSGFLGAFKLGTRIFTLGNTVYFWFAANDTSGSGADGSGPAADVRLCGAAADAIPTLSLTPTLLTHASYPAGAHEIAIAATALNGFADASTYAVFCTLLADSQNPSGFVGGFTLGASDFPAVSDVQSGVSFDHGAQTGTFAAPAVGDVQSGVQFGAAGTEFTGTFGVPATTDVKRSVQYGAGGVEFTGEYVASADYPAEDDVRDGVTFDSGTQEGNLVLPLEAVVKVGTGYGTDGTELLGALAVQNIGPSVIRGSGGTGRVVRG